MSLAQPDRMALPAPAWLPWAVATLAVAVVFRDTLAAMESIWRDSSTFAHAYLVGPIAAWLAWRERERLAAAPRRAEPWMLLPIAGACAMWLVGELAAVNAVSQFAVVTVLILLVPALLGARVTRVVLFPLLFLYFAVPFGMFLVPTFIDLTADFTVAALRATGVPVYREGAQFVVPSGVWSVVEACSGVRYLIASVMVGALFAYLNFRTLRYRAAFMLAALLVPIVANWVRAYFIVLIGHLSNNRLAVGVDHILYGWVFFGIVITLLFALGHRWSAAESRAAGAPQSPSRRLDGDEPVGAVPGAWPTVAAALAVVLATSALMARLDAPQAVAAARLALPDTAVAGWTAGELPAGSWAPAFKNARSVAQRQYWPTGDAAGAVGVWAGHYRDQGPRERMVTSTNALVDPESTTWAVVERRAATVAWRGRQIQLAGATLRGFATPGEREAQWLLVWQVYWLDDTLTASDAAAKLRGALQRLRSGRDDGAALFVHTPIDRADPAGVAAAERRLQSFMIVGLEPIVRQFEQVATGAASP